MADIRISALPNEPAPSGSDFVAIDLASTRKTTVTLLTEAGRPAATQAEAEAGVQATHAMTPLTTKQAITFQGAAAFVPQSRTLTAGSGLTGGGDLTANRSFAVNFAQVQAFSTKLTNFDATSLSAGALIFGAGVNTFSVLAAGSNNQFLQIIAGNPTWTNAAAGGDVTGPASAVTLTIPTFNGATGKIIQAGNPALLDLLTAGTMVMPTIANSAGDVTNDIDFSAGSSISTDATHWPMVGAALTKQLDAAWAVGNNAGGRMSAAAITNTTYHCFQIRRPDTGVVDYGFDVSATAPTLPTNYTQYRRIASIVRAGGAIRIFDQAGDVFTYRTAISDRSSTSAAAAALLTLSVPIGISVLPIMVLKLAANASSDITNGLGPAVAGNTTENVQQVFSTASGVSVDFANVPPIYATNTSGQIYFKCVITAGTINFNFLNTFGYVDTRGRT
jgi:hypothetical protein